MEIQEIIDKKKKEINEIIDRHRKEIKKLDAKYNELNREEEQLNNPHAVIPTCYKSFKEFYRDHPFLAHAEDCKFKNKSQAKLYLMTSSPEFQDRNKIVRI